MSEKFIYKFKGVIKRIIDADTVIATLDRGFGTYSEKRFRIGGFDAPETWRPRNDAEERHGEAATKRAIELLVGVTLIFNTTKAPGIYGRYGALITLPDGRNYSEVMIDEGFSKRENY